MNCPVLSIAIPDQDLTFLSFDPNVAAFVMSGHCNESHEIIQNVAHPAELSETSLKICKHIKFP